MIRNLKGCFVAVVTPFTPDGKEVDLIALANLIEFLISQGVTGIVVVGTTGESPTLSWDEHNLVVANAGRIINSRTIFIAGTGSNCTKEALDNTRLAVESGADAVLLVDPYYNGPSSREIRRYYYAPIAEEFPDIGIIPYIIPGRSGCRLSPEDLNLLRKKHPNVLGYKDATGDLPGMRYTRKICGRRFVILSGDDDLTFTMMREKTIAGGGVISVMTNIVPGAISRMVRLANEGRFKEAEEVEKKLKPLFAIGTVTTEEKVAGYKALIKCRHRNPLPVKTLAQLLGMPVGPCRQPLGRMTKRGFEIVWSTARQVWAETPEILSPIEKYFGVDLKERLAQPIKSWEGMLYDAEY
jgi:4-hydroxy-tetrahydrodipicolinate synthase